MWDTVLVMGVAAATGPQRLTAVVYLVLRARPKHLLLAFFCGGVGMTLFVGGVILFVLDAAGIGPASVVPSEMEIALGVFSLLTAVLIGSGLSARLRDRWQARRAREHGQETIEAAAPPTSSGWLALDQLPGYERLPQRVREALARESPWIAWVAGGLIGFPNLYVLAAIAAVLDAGVGPSTQIVALIVFSCVAFVQALIPLMSLMVAP
jgi:hypothetical protein